MDQKEISQKEPKSINAVADTFKVVITASLIMGGLVIMIKLGKEMFKDVKGTGL